MKHGIYSGVLFLIQDPPLFGFVAVTGRARYIALLERCVGLGRRVTSGRGRSRDRGLTNMGAFFR